MGNQEAKSRVLENTHFPRGAFIATMQQLSRKMDETWKWTDPKGQVYQVNLEDPGFAEQVVDLVRPTV